MLQTSPVSSRCKANMCTALENRNKAELSPCPNNCMLCLFLIKMHQNCTTQCVCLFINNEPWCTAKTPGASVVLPGCSPADPYVYAAAVFLRCWSPVVPRPVTTLKTLLGHITEHLLQQQGGGTRRRWGGRNAGSSERCLKE